MYRFSSCAVKQIVQNWIETTIFPEYLSPEGAQEDNRGGREAEPGLGGEEVQ